jgi:dethiobiotin synthetase
MALLHKGIFVTGTDTGIGKTVVVAALIKLLKAKGHVVAGAKPFESGSQKDSSWLHEESGQPADWKAWAFPYNFKAAMAPDMAAQKEGIIISVHLAMQGMHALQDNADYVVAEGAGGALVPIRGNYLMADFMAELEFPVVIVASPNLGTINHTLLTLEALRSRKCRILGVIFNRTETRNETEVERKNPEVIAKLGKLSVLGNLPCIPKVRRRLLPGVDKLNRHILLRKMLSMLE